MLPFLFSLFFEDWKSREEIRAMLKEQAFMQEEARWKDRLAISLSKSADNIGKLFVLSEEIKSLTLKFPVDTNKLEPCVGEVISDYAEDLNFMLDTTEKISKFSNPFPSIVGSSTKVIGTDFARCCHSVARQKIDQGFKSLAEAILATSKTEASKTEATVFLGLCADQTFEILDQFGKGE